MERRRFLRALERGAEVVGLLAVGGGGYRAWKQQVFDPYSGPELECWGRWNGSDYERSTALLAAAVLAASPHNTQPWQFSVSREAMEIYAQKDRNLGSLDPFRREMYLGIGCTLENLCLAARAHGYSCRTEVPPDGECAARVQFSPGVKETGGLWPAIPLRHTNRGPYLPERMLPAGAKAALEGCAVDEHPRLMLLDSTDPRKRLFADATIQATEAIVADSEMVRDSDAWFRHERADIEKYRTGLDVRGVGLSPVTTALAMMAPQPSASVSHHMWLKSTREVHLPTAPVFGLILVRDPHSREECLRAGMLWQRLHLTATAHGLAAQPLNQLPEMADREIATGKSPEFGRLAEGIAGTGEVRPAFCFRVGYAVRPGFASPRLPVESVIVSARS